MPRARHTVILALGAVLVPAAVHAPGAAAPAPLRGKTVLLDPGHNPGNGRHAGEINRLVWAAVPGGGGRKACDTTGTATNGGYPEAVFNWDVARRAGALLRARGARVVFTRTAASPAWGPCITQRAALGNRLGAHAAVSIHADGGPSSGRGFATIVPAGPIRAAGLTAAMVRADERLAIAVRNAYRAGTGMPYSSYLGSSGVYRSNAYGGTNLSRVPKIFIETGNMRNATDARLLTDAAFRQRAAAGIARGISAFLGAR